MKSFVKAYVSFLTCIYCLLVWLYVVARILLGVSPGDMFIDGIPVAFWHLGLIAFVASFISALGYGWWSR